MNCLSDRKLRLFACACCRLVWPLLTDDVACDECAEIEKRSKAHTDSGGSWETAGFMRRVKELCKSCKGTGRINRSRRAVEVAERFVDIRSPEAEDFRELHLASREATEAARGEENSPLFGTAWVCDPKRFLIAAERIRSQNGPHFDREAGAAQAALLREVVGNPWRPVTLPKVVTKATYYGIEEVCPWLTPTVLALAEAAYESREGRACGRCGGSKTVRVDPEEYAPEYGIPPPEERTDLCPACHGSGRVGVGLLDGDALLVLSDALEEAGVPDEECPFCKDLDPDFDRSIDDRTAKAVMREARQHCSCSGTGRVPHPLLQHLRTPGPHAAGCFAVDVILGKE